MSHTIQNLLDTSRKELLDFSMRNPLLNYRLPKTKGLSLICNQPDLAFQALVQDKKSIGFKSRSTQVTNTDLTKENPNTKPVFSKFETLEPEASLQKRLLSTFSTAQSIIQEQGVNILFVSFGMLHWLEDDSSSEFRQAPLILIPVVIQRKEVKDQFNIVYSEADFGVNVSLKAKLKAEFGIELPDFDEDIDLPLVDYFNQVNQLIKHKERWRLEAYKTELGFFSFGKYLIYNDLDSTVWPDDKKPFDHEILKGLFGDGFNHPPFPSDSTFIDQHPQVHELFQVVDADSSQILNLLEVHEGKHLVIQGPPGTGKSQTITNIIGNAIGQGKKVLFVAEKMAALEVVKRRMDMCGLGEACLELHSHKANKKDLLAELKRVLDLGKPQTSQLEAELSLLQSRKDELNLYSDAVNSEIENSRLTFHQVIGILLSIKESCKQIKLPELPHHIISDFNAEQFKNASDLLDGIERKLKEIGSPKNLVFYGSKFKSVLPKQINLIQERSQELLKAFTAYNHQQLEVFTHYQLEVPELWKEQIHQLSFLDFIISAPVLHDVDIRNTKWINERAHLNELIKAGLAIESFNSSVLQNLKHDVFKQDWTEVKSIFEAHHQKWYRFLIGDFRKAKKLFLSYSTKIQKPKDSEIPAIIDSIIQAQYDASIISKNAELAATLFQSKWNESNRSFKELEQINEFMFSFAQMNFPSSFFKLMQTDKSKALAFKMELNKQAELFHDAWNKWKTTLEFDEAIKGPLVEMKSVDIQSWFQKLIPQIGDLSLVCSWNISLELIHERNLDFIIPLCLEWEQAASYLRMAFKNTWLETLYEKALNTHPVLKRFDRNRHEELIQKFREEDQLNFQLNRAKASLTHFNSLPNVMAGGQMMVLRTEMNKKIRHLPLRKLIEQAGLAIQDIKPVFMMSPMSIATYIPPGVLNFDLVIFDEASQVKPVEALGAILRGKQLVVVGDSKQLPPTNFFETISDDIDEEVDNLTQDIESILGLANAKGIGGGMLRWHYRSKHESLIKVSNFEFYDNRLIVFPSASNHEKLGLKLRYHPETFYDRGQSRSNKPEAVLVMDAVLNHIRNYPKLSLGIVSFSNAQKEVLENLFEQARKEYPEIEAYVQAHVDEPLFIKNLENVQGDERDVIFISIGYGKTKEGYLAMNFGPLNGLGGERRLNVLITRARQCCEVFTNIKAADLNTDKTNSLGVKALKNFLYFAETGNLNMSKETERPADSYFEIHVAERLRELGYDIVHQVGANGFFIDLAAKDENGNFILGIECDGRMYHSARSARDRDRLRQQVLEGMGWTIHRIWSTDWFANPDREVKRTAEAIEKALLDRNLPIPAFEESKSKNPPILREDIKQDKQSVQHYQMAALNIQTNGKELHQLSLPVLADWMLQIVQIEAPVHLEEVGRRLIDALGISRLGSRIRAHIEDAATYGSQKGIFIRRNNFLYAANERAYQIRDRSLLPQNSRKLEFIANEELYLAFAKVVKEAYQIEDEEALVMVASLFGFSRLTEELKSDMLLRFEEWKLQK
ncbi:MAG: DUF3320 domain-containing protein [Bacteroidia bacterium]